MDGWPTSQVWFQSLLLVRKLYYQLSNTQTYTHTSSGLAAEGLQCLWSWNHYCLPKDLVYGFLAKRQRHMRVHLCAHVMCMSVSAKRACTLVPCWCDVYVLPADTASVSLEEVVCLFLFAHHSAAQPQPHLLSVCTLVLHTRNSTNYRSWLFWFTANILLPKGPDIFVFSNISAHTINLTFLLRFCLCSFCLCILLLLVILLCC